MYTLKSKRNEIWMLKFMYLLQIVITIELEMGCIGMEWLLMCAESVCIRIRSKDKHLNNINMHVPRTNVYIFVFSSSHITSFLRISIIMYSKQL